MVENRDLSNLLATLVRRLLQLLKSQESKDADLAIKLGGHIISLADRESVDVFSSVMSFLENYEIALCFSLFLNAPSLSPWFDEYRYSQALQNYLSSLSTHYEVLFPELSTERPIYLMCYSFMDCLTQMAWWFHCPLFLHLVAGLDALRDGKEFQDEVLEREYKCITAVRHALLGILHVSA